LLYIIYIIVIIEIYKYGVNQTYIF